MSNKRIMETVKEIVQAAAAAFDAPPKSFTVVDEYGNEWTYALIVRCSDCAKWATENRFTGGCIGPNGDIDSDGFCSWSERKGVG